MSQVIVFTQSDGVVGYLVPAPNCPLSLKEIADKDVPTGLAYWIVDSSELPTAPQESWELVDMPEPDGYGE